MGEEEKAPAAAAAPEGGAPPAEAGAAPGPDMAGMPGGMMPAKAGKDVVIPQLYFFIGIAVIILLIGGGLYGAYYLGHQKAVMREGAVRKANEYLGPVYPLEIIRANITATGAEAPPGTAVPAPEKQPSDRQPRILEIKVSLVLNANEAVDEINKRYPQIIDLLFYLVQKKTYEELDSIPDQGRLKREIRDQLNAILSQAKVKDVYFERYRIMPVKPVEVIKTQEEE
jgi:flagellar basal body-associated protein FliL